MHSWQAGLAASFLVWTAVIGAAAAPRDAARDAPSAVRQADDRSGRALYQAACATCHGSDGRGQPRTHVGFETPIPDFTDCAFATPEPDADWLAVIHDGGPARAFDRRMPAFGEALREEEMARILAHVRTFCGDGRWPRGELNLPRALVTEKAFPENETVLTMSASSGDAGSVATELVYERRLGARSQVELVVPFALQQAADDRWQKGLGDVAVAFKHAIAHSLGRGSILAVAGEVILPTGKEAEGLGGGATVFEPFVSIGQILPSDSFVQAQAGLELPVSDDADNEVFWRVAAGHTFVEGRFGRAWSPMVELLAAKALDGNSRTEWDVVPQVQVTLNRRQHVMLNAGVRVPLNQRHGRSTTVLMYLLWDWFDGGLLDGWR